MADYNKRISVRNKLRVSCLKSHKSLTEMVRQTKLAI